MTARANPTLALRPMLPADAPLLAELFRASIEELTADDYSDAQRAAWASAVDDVAAFGARLAGQLTLVATLGGAPVGFASLKDAEGIDMLYVHPAAAGQGAASLLLEAIEKLAAARGAPRPAGGGSDRPPPRVRPRGYALVQRNTVSCGGEWLANTTMRKALAARAANEER